MTRIPVVFIHDVWLHASSWQAWARRFGEHGFSVVVPRWPGEDRGVTGTLRDPSGLGEVGLEALTAHYSRLTRSLGTAPVLIGHGVGGLVAQQLLGANLGCAAVAIAAVPINDIPWALPTELEPTSFADPIDPGPIRLPPSDFRKVFANTTDADEAADLFERFVIAAPPRLLTDIGGSDGSARRYADVDNRRRGPLLLISGQEDRLVPDAVTRSVYKLYGDSSAVSELKQFADRGHCLVIDRGWRSIADHVLAWLDAHGIRPR
ncbi:alpha/beta hydrolase [Nocardia xishanensis]|uniref:alpha/beta hydrolase n=1 Tax=Nocardia xishanensis TaxID=238964 RepID=UPI00340540E9